VSQDVIFGVQNALKYICGWGFTLDWTMLGKLTVLAHML